MKRYIPSCSFAGQRQEEQITYDRDTPRGELAAHNALLIHTSRHCSYSPSWAGSWCARISGSWWRLSVRRGSGLSESEVVTGSCKRGGKEKCLEGRSAVGGIIENGWSRYSSRATRWMYSQLPYNLEAAGQHSLVKGRSLGKGGRGWGMFIYVNNSMPAVSP